MAFVEISNTTDTRLGRIDSLTGWDYSDPLDAAGDFSFSMPASDIKSSLISSKYKASCFGLVNGSIQEIGSGIVDSIGWKLSTDGIGLLEVKGQNLLSDLGRTVGNLTIDDGAGNATTTAPQLLIALAKAGWSLDIVNGFNVTSKAIKHQFSGESLLSAFIKAAELSGDHFRIGSGKKIVWLKNTTPSSGYRIYYNINPDSYLNNPKAIAATDIEKVSESYECFIGRVYAIGSGSGASQITLNGATGVGLPAGYVLGSDSKGYYLQHTSTWTTYSNDCTQSFKDIDSAQMLQEAAYEWLKRQINPIVSYKISLAGVRQKILPGTTIVATAHKYVGSYRAIDINNELLYILEAKNKVDSSGLRTVEIVTATSDTLPKNDSDAFVRNTKMLQALAQHAQPYS